MRHKESVDGGGGGGGGYLSLVSVQGRELGDTDGL